MGSGVQYNSAGHAELKGKMDEIKEVFSELISEFESVNSIVGAEFKGEAATALQTALQGKISQLKSEKNGWNTVITNAEQLEEALIEADQNAKLVIQTQPYVQGNGGKVY